MTVNWTGARWKKASDSGSTCVEVALWQPGDMAGIRDSKDPNGPVLEFRKETVLSFIRSLSEDR